MNAYYPNGGPLGHWKEVDPLADERQAVRFLYGNGTSETDIAGSAVKFTGGGGSNLVSSPTSAFRGTTVPMEFTFSNQSTSTQTFDIGFYLSSDSFISTGDILLAYDTGWWGTAGFTGTFTRNVTIPGWIAPGTYYLGFIIDPSNHIGEKNESNNYQEMPRTIVIH
jgi:hypothetical protein